MSPQILPGPSLVLQTARDLAADNLFSNLWISLQRLAWGFGAGVFAGALLGIVMGLSRRAEAILYPTFIAVEQIPTLAWIPLLMMLLGLGEALKIVIIVKAVMTPVTIYTHVGVRDVDPKLLESARALRLSPARRLCSLILPASLPSFMTGLRLGLAQGWTSLLAVELLASSEGIGYLMVWGRSLFQLDVVFVCIFVIGAVGLAMDKSFERIDHAVVRWPRKALAERPAGSAASGAAWKLVLPVALLALWRMADARGWVDVKLLPAPSTVLATLSAGLADGSLVTAMIESLRRSLLGLAIGASAGLATGLAMGLAPRFDRALGATLTVLRVVALFAWLPLLTAWFGLGEPAKIAFVALATFLPMQLATQRGVANLSPQLVEAARTLRLGPLDRLRVLVLPGAAPSIFAGLRLALLQAWIATMGAEYFMTSGGGIGTLMVGAQQLFRVDLVMAAMILVGVVAAAIGLLGKAIETRATRWRSA